jgi:hypothetical protein
VEIKPVAYSGWKRKLIGRILIAVTAAGVFYLNGFFPQTLEFWVRLSLFMAVLEVLR